jgi:hypothetical protein
MSSSFNKILRTDPFIINIIFAAVFLPIICYAQPNVTLEATNWGKAVMGARLSIAVSNNIIVADSKILLTCRTKNTSTNEVIITVSDPRAMFEVSLIGVSGKTYELNDPTSIDVFMNTLYTLKSNEIYACNVPIQIEKSIEPGNYKIRVRQTISIERNRYELVSNLLEVQIK